MKEMCKKCVKKKECVKLCKEAEEYVNQDYILQPSDTVYKNIQNTSELVEWSNIDLDDYRIIRDITIDMYLRGKSIKEIAYHLPRIIRQIQRIIKEYKEKNDTI